MAQLVTVECTGTAAIQEALKIAHEGHFGVRKTWQLARQLGVPVTEAEAADYVRRCRACQQFNPRTPSLPLGHILDPGDVNEKLAMDYIGPLQTAPGGVRYIFVLVDALSRMGMAVAFQKSTMESTKRGISRWIEMYGAPRSILCDRASYFQSSKFREWAWTRGIDIMLTAPHAHHSNGLAERWNQNLVNRIRRMMADGAGNSWSSVLRRAVELLNGAAHAVTLLSPRYLHLGVRDDGTRATNEDLKRDRKAAVERNRIMREKYEDAWNGRKFQPGVGERVWVFDSVRCSRLDDKMSPFWVGPFTVTEIFSPHIYWVKHDDHGQQVVVHVDNLQPYY